MRIYIAGRYGRREEFCGYARVLRGRGSVVTSRWLEGKHSAEDVEEPTVAEQCAWATEDLLDIEQSDALWAFTEEPLQYTRHSFVGRGGRHVELGYALARLRDEAEFRVVVIGPRENVFCSLEEVLHYETFEEALRKELEERDDAA